MAGSGNARAPLVPVILSGGSGSRLWPISREAYPKQLQRLCTDNTLLQETALRLAETDAAPPVVVCNEAHRFIVAEQLREVGVDPAAILIEPEGRNTAPAVAVAALHVAQTQPDAVLLVMPSDHLVTDVAAFRAALDAGRKALPEASAVTFGIAPDGPSSAYGYIRADGTGPVRDVAAFVEKPDTATAAGYLADGGYFWNAGIFLFGATAYLDALDRFEPQVRPACTAALAEGQNDLFFFRLDGVAFARAPSVSIDYGLMERLDGVKVVPVSMGWSDVGSFSALHEQSPRDALGNTVEGDVMLVDTHNSFVRSDRQLTATIGLRDTVVVVEDDAVLVAALSHDQQVREVVSRLKAQARPEAVEPARIYRPWGWYQTIEEGPRFKVKHIYVKPGASLSLQKHWHRSEHWVVVTGSAMVVRGEGDEFLLRENESTFIPAGTLHRLRNPGKVGLAMIEVQSGEYVGEDDIERFEDLYGRSEEDK